MIRNQGIGAYKTTQVTAGADQKTLIVMAYDGVLRFLSRARTHIEAREVEAAHDDLVRSRDIVEELASTLNLEAGGQIARNLWNLYVFFVQKITEANLTKDASIIDGVLPAIRELRDAWASLEIAREDAKIQALNQRVPTVAEAHRVSVAG